MLENEFQKFNVSELTLGQSIRSLMTYINDITLRVDTLYTVKQLQESVGNCLKS